MFLTDFITSFTLGLLTPLTAVCVLPLYPGFLIYLSNKLSPNATKKQYALLGSIIVLGVISFMFILGLLFTTILKFPLTNVIGIVSPIAFIILLILGLFLIFNINMGKFLPKFQNKLTNKPLRDAFFFGFFFGAIVIPCNPAFIGAFLARSFLMANPLTSIFNFLFFGIGLGFPLLFFSLISTNYSNNIITFLTKHKKPINIISGIIMVVIAIYYIVFVFRVFG